MATAAEITQIYQNVLGREPDAEGLAYWSQALSGQSAAQATQQIAQAAAAVNPAGQSAEIKQAVQSAQNFLSAPPTQQVTATTTAPITTAAPSVTGGMITGAGPTNIAQIYQNVLGRAPDAEGLAYWNRILAGASPEEASRKIAQVAANINPSGQPAEIQQSINRAKTYLDMLPVSPTTGDAGQYGYRNGAPILNANVAKQLLGNEFDKKLDISQNNQLGWGTNSKYQGRILTGAGLYGIRGSSEEIQKILAAGDQLKQLEQQGKVVVQTDPENGTPFYTYLSGTDPETGRSSYTRIENLFFTEAGEEGSNGDVNFKKWQDTTAKLQDAATKLNIPIAGKTGIQLLNDINAADKRVAVIGRTQYWDPSQTGGIGMQEGAPHATVVYQQVGDKLIPAAPVQTFNFQDPNTSRGFFGDLIGGFADLISIPPIAMALSAFGAPYIASALTSQFGLSDIAARAVSAGLISGTTTGAITGDAEKALIAALMGGAGSYAVNSGIAGDALDKIGLGDYKGTFGILNTDQVSQVQMVANDAIQLKNQGLGVQGIQDNLIAAGVDPALAASTANMAVSGGTVASIAQDLAGFAVQPQGLFTGPGTGFGITTTGGLGTATGAGTAGAGTTVGGTATGAGLGAGAGAVGAGAGAATGAGGGAVAGGGGAGIGTGLGTGVGGLLTGAGNLLNNILPGLGNLNIGGALGAGIDFAQLAALQREATGLGRQIGAEATQIGREGAVPFTPYTVTTGAGVGTVGPGGATAVTAPEFQALRQQQLGLAGQALGAVNPAQAAQTLYGQVEALAAPGRAREQEALLQGLQARGLTGFGQNLPTVGGQIRTVNPLFESLLSAQETARAQQALQAQQFGTQEAARQAALGQGLIGGAQNIDQQTLAALNAAATLGQQERAIASRNALLQAEASLQGLRLRQPYEQIGLSATGQALAGAGSAARGLFGLPTQTGNVLGNLTLGQLLGGGTGGTSPLGQGTGPQYGYQDYGIFF